MNKNSKHKLLAITFLLSLLSIYSMYAALIPVVQATEPNIQDKAMAVLSDVVGINTESYATNLNSQVDKEYRGLTEKEVNLYFSSEQSQLRASCTFVNNNLHLIYISDYEGTPSLKRSSANTADMAKGCLKEYENYRCLI
jgi:ABC-type bacteriocin/lantibiotic exporter with double-glycine peptidase domain